MIQEEIKVKVLKASEGYVLTQKKDVNVMDRIFSDCVYLAVNDNVENWKEITVAEADALIAERDKIINDLAE